MKKQNKNKIPYPNLQSYTHKRTAIPKKQWKDILERYYSQSKEVQMIESMLTRFFKKTKLLHSKIKWAFFKIVIKIIRIFYKIYHRMEIQGTENIPKGGPIFYINHPKKIDVVMSFLGAFGKPVGAFTDVGEGISADILEMFGFVPRLGHGKHMVEKMIRQILLQNRYFVIWPEGTPDKGVGIMQGFSGIVRVYATINSEKNIIPFCPVITQISYPKIPKKKGIKRKLLKNVPPKIIYRYLEPFFIKREWLKPPEKGGKTRRKIMDFMMRKIARKFGQKKLGPNPVLNRRKKNFHKAWH